MREESRKEKYHRSLKSRKWYNFRDKVLSRDGYRCTSCGSEDNLQAHHLYYIDGREPWEYEIEALVTLCEKCHNQWHKDHHIVVRKDDNGAVSYGGKKKRGRRKNKREKRAYAEAHRYDDLPACLRKKIVKGEPCLAKRQERRGVRGVADR
jgi:hypothetical protein